LSKRLASLLVFSAGAGGGVQTETVVANRELGLDHDSGTAPESELDRAPPQLGPAGASPDTAARASWAGLAFAQLVVDAR
jgi:hypothetical protein